MTSCHFHIPAFLKQQPKMVVACGKKEQSLGTSFGKIYKENVQHKKIMKILPLLPTFLKLRNIWSFHVVVLQGNDPEKSMHNDPECT